MTAALGLEASTPVGPSDDLHHLFCCCDQNLALCGADLTCEPLTDGEGETPCPMCFTVEDDPCPHCGCPECTED